MAAAIHFYNSASEYLLDGTFDLNSNTIKCLLTTSSYVPSATHTVKADVTNELTTANGYTAGGLTLTPTLTRVGNVTTFDLTDAVWNATGSGITSRYAVVYISGTINARTDPLLFYVLLDTAPNDLITPSGEQHKIVWDVLGVFDLTVPN